MKRLFRPNTEHIAAKVMEMLATKEKITLTKIAHRAELSPCLLLRILKNEGEGIHAATAVKLRRFFGEGAVISDFMP